MHERLRHWLALQPPDRFAVIDPDEELRRILAAEIEAAVGFPAVAMAPEACRDAAALAGSIPVVLLSKYDALRATLPADAECVALKVRSVPGSLAAWMPIPSDALIVVASRWQGFNQWARAVLLSAGVDPDALELRDARRPRWQHGLQHARIVIVDVVTARSVPSGCRTLAFPVVSDASLDELRRTRARDRVGPDLAPPFPKPSNPANPNLRTWFAGRPLVTPLKLSQRVDRRCGRRVGS